MKTLHGYGRSDHTAEADYDKFDVNQCNVLNLYVMCSNVLNHHVVKTIIHSSGLFLFNRGVEPPLPFDEDSAFLPLPLDEASAFLLSASTLLSFDDGMKSSSSSLSTTQRQE